MALIVLATTSAVLVGCSGSDEQPAASRTLTVDSRNDALFKTLAAYPRATLVRQFITTGRGPEVFSSDYATPDSYEDIIAFFHNELASAGWQQDPHVEVFRKGGDMVTLNVYGPGLPGLGSGYDSSPVASPPDGTLFYFGVSVVAQQPTQSPTPSASGLGQETPQ